MDTQDRYLEVKMDEMSITEVIMFRISEKWNFWFIKDFAPWSHNKQQQTKIMFSL